MANSLLRLALIVALLLWAMRTCRAQDENWSIKGLLAQYNCSWVRDMRKTHTDDELRAMAKELHLPDVVIRMAERCPR